MTPPLRFLLAVAGGWTCLRAAALAPWGPPNAAAPPQAVPRAVAFSPAAPPPGQRAAPPSAELPLAVEAHRPAKRGMRRVARLHRLAVGDGFAHLPALPEPASTAFPRAAPSPPRALAPEPAERAGQARWSLDAWAHLRGGNPPGLAAGGSLGGSQAGARLRYRLGRPGAGLALTARIAAAARGSGAEAAVGAEWQPSPAVPLRLTLERRQRIGRDGRSAFAVGAHGGVSGLPVAAGFRLDAYGQAGAVGLASRDLYADGGARLTRPVAKGVHAGVGAWGAAQPGVARADLGPSLSIRAGPAVLALDWRLRVAGNARPGSGPALTVATGF